MKIVPLFPRVQTREAQVGRSPRDRVDSREPRPGVTVELKSGTSQTSDLSRDEAFILLGRTMAQLNRAGSGTPVDGLHRVRGDKAVNLLVSE